MKSVGLLLVVSVAAFGQRPAGAARPGGVHSRPATFGNSIGFGNVVYPGTGHAPLPNRSITDTGFGARLGSTVSGYPGYTGAPAIGGRRQGATVVYVPYGYGIPMYAEPAPPQVIVYPQPQSAPQVVINQNFTSETARPVVQEYVSDAAGGIRVYAPPARTPAPPEEVTTYLIAFKDHTIYAALAYWVEGDTLHYVTNQNTHNQVSLDLIDRDFSERLNRERNVNFRLPPAR